MTPLYPGLGKPVFDLDFNPSAASRFWICISVFIRIARWFSSDDLKVHRKSNNQTSRFPEPRRTASAKPS